MLIKIHIYTNIKIHIYIQIKYRYIEYTNYYELSFFIKLKIINLYKTKQT